MKLRKPDIYPMILKVSPGRPTGGIKTCGRNNEGSDNDM